MTSIHHYLENLCIKGVKEATLTPSASQYQGFHRNHLHPKSIHRGRSMGPAGTVRGVETHRVQGVVVNEHLNVNRRIIFPSASVSFYYFFHPSLLLSTNILSSVCNEQEIILDGRRKAIFVVRSQILLSLLQDPW